MGLRLNTTLGEKRENTEIQTNQHIVTIGLVMGFVDSKKKNITRLIFQHNQIKT